MLKFGNIMNNILVLGILIGFGYIIYMKMKGNKPAIFEKLLDKGKDLKDDSGFREGGRKFW